jgi:hypothetical protein
MQALKNSAKNTCIILIKHDGIIRSTEQFGIDIDVKGSILMPFVCSNLAITYALDNTASSAPNSTLEQKESEQRVQFR